MASALALTVVTSVARWMAERGLALPSAVVSPFDFTSFLELKRQGFVGREWLFAQIEEWRTKRSEKALLIVTFWSRDRRGAACKRRSLTVPLAPRWHVIQRRD